MLKVGDYLCPTQEFLDYYKNDCMVTPDTPITVKIVWPNGRVDISFEGTARGGQIPGPLAQRMREAYNEQW